MPGVYYRFPIYKSTIDSTAPSFYKKETGKASIPYDESVEEALCFGWIDSIIRKMDEQRFARRFTPRDSSSRWSKLNMERAEKMMKEGKMEELGMSKIMDAKKTGEWCSSASPPGKLETPLFMKEASLKTRKPQGTSIIWRSPTNGSISHGSRMQEGMRLEGGASPKLSNILEKARNWA